MNDEKSKPKFLIIGSMKCGTTGLFNDLASHPGVFVPLGDKEPEFFTTDNAYKTQCLSEYLSLFADIGPNQIAGEASTAYTKAPDFSDAPQRAKKILGPDIKLIFIFRDPIQRIISHHHHEITHKRVTDSIDDAIRKHPEFINYSKYHFQLMPWIKEFGVGNLHLVDFDLYKTDRKQTVEKVIEFLDLSTEGFEIDENKVYNVSKNKTMLSGFWKSLYHTGFYQQFVRRIVSQRLRRFVFNRIMPKSPFEKQKPSDDTLAFLSEQLRDDQKKFHQLYKSFSGNS